MSSPSFSYSVRHVVSAGFGFVVLCSAVFCRWQVFFLDTCHFAFMAGGSSGVTIRLLVQRRDYMGRGYKIIAVDFDGTLCTDKYPEIGSPARGLINLLKSRKEAGDKLILWTCRVGERLQEAVGWCSQSGLEFDAVNENLPEMIEYFGQDTRKIHADVYIDDKAVNETSADFV